MNKQTETKESFEQLRNTPGIKTLRKSFAYGDYEAILDNGDVVIGENIEDVKRKIDNILNK